MKHPGSEQPEHGANARTAGLATPTHLEADHLYRLDLDGEPVPYTLRRSLRRRRAMLSLHDHGLVLSVPVRMSTRAIDTFLAHSLPWLRRHLPRWRTLIGRDAGLVALREVLLLGESLTVELMPAMSGAPDQTPRRARAPSFVRDTDRLQVIAAQALTNEALRHALRQWVQTQALPWFGTRAQALAPQIGVAVPPLELSNARTLWGSCTPDGRVRLNWRLLQAPPRLIDYVVAHELAHLIERNHSSRFWAVVARACPDHRAARSELSDWQRRLSAL